MCNDTRVSEYLTLDRVKLLEAKAMREAQSGWPLNVAISVRFLGDHLLPLDRCSKRMKDRRREEVFDMIKKVLRCLRGMGIVPRYVWTREAEDTGAKEHLHLILHVPSGKTYIKFKNRVKSWQTGPGQIKVQRINQLEWYNEDTGERQSFVLYITKQIHEVDNAIIRNHHWEKDGRKACGLVYGKRSAHSRDLGLSVPAVFSPGKKKPSPGWAKYLAGREPWVLVRREDRMTKYRAPVARAVEPIPGGMDRQENLMP
jgi:hypothetical protein